MTADRAGAVVWVTGLPASGKSTLAVAIAARLRSAGAMPIVLDGDEVREAIVPRHGYDPDGRDAFYRTLGELAALIARQGAIAIVPATAHHRRWREHARCRAPRFVEVWVATPIEECRRRDPKGLYARLGAGGGLPGSAGTEYEPPLHPEVIARGGDDGTAIAAVVASVNR
jgi:adenylylsulfate kinase